MRTLATATAAATPPGPPARLLAWLRRRSPLQIALLASLAIHAVLLTLRFTDPERFNRLFENTPLEVVLVNARSEQAPTQAKAIAQSQLAGGGEAVAGRATTPLPPSALNRAGDAAQDTALQQIEQMQLQQMQLLAQLRRDLAALPPPDPTEPARNPTQVAQEERRQQMLRMLAEIDKRIQEENARPRKRFVSPATREAAYAAYYDTLRQRIEARGTRDFPQAGGQKLYGSLTMQITVDARGRVVDAQVVVPSGNRALDSRALAIARAAAPFGGFTEAMRREADQIVVTSLFRFSREDGLETKLLAR